MPRVSVPNLDSMPDAPGKPVAGEYTVQVDSYEETVSKRTGRGGLRLNIMLVDGPDLDNGQPASSFPFPIRTTLWYPQPGDPEKTENALGSRIKEACTAFGVYIDSEGFDSDDFIGQQAQAEIGPQESSPQYSEVYRFIVQR